MKILVICSFNSGKINPFIEEQVNSLKDKGYNFEYFKVVGKGFKGYLKNYPDLFKKIVEGNYDLVHAHYGLSGLLANMQRKVPVITTYHGSDVHYKSNRLLSFITCRLAHFNILTHSKQTKQLRLNKNYAVIKCGIDTNLFCPEGQTLAKRKLGFNKDKNYVLFSSSFDREVKNYPLAKKAIHQLQNVELVELKGYNRKEVVTLINACDLILITSFYETGPLVVKEALACNTPVVSTDVGDVKELIHDLDNCYITTYESNDVAQKIKRVLDSDKKCEGRKKVEKYDLNTVAKKVADVYKQVVRTTNRGLKSS